MLRRYIFPALIFSALIAGEARAQDDEPIDIEVGSSRIGGPGTQQQRKSDDAWNAAVEEENMPMTEETLPPPGNKKRLPGLHKLAKQYFGGRMWKDACEKFDQIIDESQDAGLETDPDGKKNAARSYYECASIAFFSSEYDKTEKLLKKSEKYGPSDHRHQGLRRKMARENYRKLMANGDWQGAVEMFKKYQAEEADEDERIWMGEQLATLSWNAYSSKDKIGMKTLMEQTEQIAPMNTEYRKLKEKLEGEDSVLTNALLAGVAALLFVVGWTQFSKWRARARVRRMDGGQFGGLDEEA